MQRLTPIHYAAVAVAALAAAPLSHAADSLDYTYLQLDFIGLDIDNYDDDAGVIEDFDDGGGFGLHGSLAVSDNFFLYGGYSDTESDVSFSNADVFPIPAQTDIRRLDLGVGGIVEINDQLDFVGRLGYVDIDFGEFDFGASSNVDANDLREDDSDGYLVDMGVRSQLLENLEGSIGVRYIDIQNVDNTSLIGSLQFELTSEWDINFSIDAGDDVSTYLLGVRYSPSR